MARVDKVMSLSLPIPTTISNSRETVIVILSQIFALLNELCLLGPYTQAALYLKGS